MIGHIAHYLLKTGTKAQQILATAAAERHAVLGENSKIMEDGKVVNIAHDRNRIKIGKNTRVRGEVLIFPDSGSIEIGDWAYIGPRTQIWSGDPDGIKIGDRVLISSDVIVHDTNSHPLNHKDRFEQTQSILSSGHPNVALNIRTSAIRIGDDVWIGSGAMIAKGVEIGDRSIVGARALILSSVVSDSIIHAGQIHRKVSK